MPKRSPSGGQMDLAGVVRPTASARECDKRLRIPLLAILSGLEEPGGGARGIVEIYRKDVLTGRTRTLQLLGRKNRARILHTLLGYEVKASFKRLHCPDLVTALYLKVFTELGCRTIKLPYDPTVTARLVPELERAVERVALEVRRLCPDDRASQIYVTRELYRRLRKQLR